MGFSVTGFFFARRFHAQHVAQHLGHGVVHIIDQQARQAAQQAARNGLLRVFAHPIDHPLQHALSPCDFILSAQLVLAGLFVQLLHAVLQRLALGLGGICGLFAACPLQQLGQLVFGHAGQHIAFFVRVDDHHRHQLAFVQQRGQFVAQGVGGGAVGAVVQTGIALGAAHGVGHEGAGIVPVNDLVALGLKLGAAAAVVLLHLVVVAVRVGAHVGAHHVHKQVWVSTGAGGADRAGTRGHACIGVVKRGLLDLEHVPAPDPLLRHPLAHHALGVIGADDFA